MIEDCKNKLLLYLMNIKIHYGIFVALLVFLIIRYNIKKRRRLLLLKQEKYNEKYQKNNQSKNNTKKFNNNGKDRKEIKDEKDVASKIEIIKNKNEGNRRKQNNYNKLIAERFSFLYRLNPISVFMMIRQDSSTTNPIPPINSQQPENEEQTSTSSSKNLYNNDKEFNHSSVHDILKLESNDSSSHSHHSGALHQNNESNDSNHSEHQYNQYTKNEPTSSSLISNSNLRDSSNDSNITKSQSNDNPSVIASTSHFQESNEVQNNTSIPEATTSTNTVTNSNIEREQTPQSNVYSYLFGSFNSIKETVFGKPKGKLISEKKLIKFKKIL